MADEPVTVTTIDPPATCGYTFGSYSSLDDAVIAIVQAIETEMTKIANTTDKKLATALEQVNTAHTASIAQVLRESQLADLYEMNFLEPEKMTPLKAYMFAKSLEGLAERTGYGQASDIIERLATDDLYGDAIKATMRQARNARLLEPLGVNVERSRIPTGDYYRNPIDYTQLVYYNELPEQANYAAPIDFPKTTEEKYLIARDAQLADDGHIIDDLTPGQKDELYYDSQWRDNNDDINRNIGENVVAEALRRNLKLLGDDLIMIDLDKNRLNVGKVTPKGVDNYNYDLFISTLFSIVNRILYGNIGVTKLDNPFHTDEIIYAVAEALGGVNAANIELLQGTFIGGSVLYELLTKIANRYSTISTVNDTRMDRNDPSTFGGVGPGLNPNIQS
jgi:hypothetical protein